MDRTIMDPAIMEAKSTENYMTMLQKYDLSHCVFDNLYCYAV